MLYLSILHSQYIQDSIYIQFMAICLSIEMLRVLLREEKNNLFLEDFIDFISILTDS